MDMEVVVSIPEDNRISIQFKNKSLEEVLKLIQVNYALVADSKGNDGNIKRIVVVPEGQQAQMAVTTSDNYYKKNEKGMNKEKESKKKSFEFEFDLSKITDSQ